MLTKKQLSIFAMFVKYPYKELTRKEVKMLSKEKSNNALSIAFAEFKKENLLLEKKVGKSSLYQLNLSNDLVHYYLALSNKKRLKPIVEISIKHILTEVRKITSFFSIVIFGSHSIGEEKKDSDLDVAIFIEDRNKVKDIQSALWTANIKSILTLDAHVIVRDDFFEMLTNDEENLGKEIARKHMVVYNHQLFYDLVQEGINYGFKF